MPKVKYNGITFDSELEVEYYKYLMANHDVVDFTYHPKQPIAVTKGNNYYPDFVVFYSDEKDYLRCEIVECKGYSQYSFMKDNMIHNIMLSKTELELNQWLLANNLYKNCPVVYRKIKYLKAYGFVDWEFKNPNTLANKRKEKINDLSTELKELKDFKKNALRYYTYHLKIVRNEKLTKAQKEWYCNYVEEIKRMVEDGK